MREDRLQLSCKYYGESFFRLLREPNAALTVMICYKRVEANYGKPARRCKAAAGMYLELSTRDALSYSQFCQCTDLPVKSSTWCLLHHAQDPKDNYYDHYSHDEPDDTAHLIIPF